MHGFSAYIKVIPPGTARACGRAGPKPEKGRRCFQENPPQPFSRPGREYNPHLRCYSVDRPIIPAFHAGDWGSNPHSSIRYPCHGPFSKNRYPVQSFHIFCQKRIRHVHPEGPAPRIGTTHSVTKAREGEENGHGPGIASGGMEDRADPLAGGNKPWELRS